MAVLGCLGSSRKQTRKGPNSQSKILQPLWSNLEQTTTKGTLQAVVNLGSKMFHHVSPVGWEPNMSPLLCTFPAHSSGPFNQLASLLASSGPQMCSDSVNPDKTKRFAGQLSPRFYLQPHQLACTHSMLRCVEAGSCKF